MVIWLVFAVLTACVILAVTRSLGRANSPESQAEPEIGAYKLQLAELDRDEERGTLSNEEASQTRAEIARRILKANRRGAGPLAPERIATVNANRAFIALAVLITAGALGLYVRFGKPAVPDQPLEARLNVPVEKQTLDIQIANVERRLRANPRDGLGWSVLAPVYFRSGQFEKAADAFRRAIQLNGENETLLLGLAESLTFTNNGVISDQAKLALSAALLSNPKSLRGRFWYGILAEQDGNKPEAERIYRGMLSENIHDALRAIVSERLEALNAPAATESAQPREQVASGDPLQGEQGAMIRGMVEGLAERLKENKGELQDWLKLIRSYAVLKETAKAQETAATARQHFAADPCAMEQIGSLERTLGLALPATDGAPPKS